MLKQRTSEENIESNQNGQTSQNGEGTPSRASMRLLKIVAAAGVVAILLALLPSYLPALADSMSGSSPQAYWYISRASAFVAFGLLWLSMLAGLGITSKLGRFWPGMPGTYELHKVTSLLGIGFGLIHALTLLGDQYMNYSIAQLLVPFMGSNYRPEWVGFGQLAFYMLVVVSFSFYVRNRIGVYTWRMIHMLSFALFLMVLMHGVQSGSDTSGLWAQLIYWTSAVSVLLGSVYRALAHRTGRPKQSIAAKRLVAAAGRTQVDPHTQVLVPGRLVSAEGARVRVEQRTSLPNYD